MTIILRPYQTAARDAARRHWQAGNRAALIVLPTGTGKTEVILGTLEAEIFTSGFTRGLIIAHRKELIYQPRDRAAKNWPNLPPFGVVMADENEAGARIVVATIQTLAGKGRLDQLLSFGAFSHVVIDEAHHTPAKTYQDVLNALWLANPGMKLLGVTATPKRTDREGLAAVYGKDPVYRVLLSDSIKNGALSPFQGIGAELPVSAKGVKLVGSNGDKDYDQEEMGAVMDVGNAREIIVKTWIREAADRPTMAFTSSVAQAHHLAADLNRSGYRFTAVDGTTPADERARIIAEYQAGRLHGIVNCQVFTEGFDAPHTSCILMAKPTRSDLIYVQCVGRGLRTHPSKADCLILDFAPQDCRDIMMAGDLIGKPKAERKAEEKAQEKGIILSSFGVGRDGSGIDGDPNAVKLRLLDLLSSSPFQWSYGQDVASVVLSLEHMAAVVMPQPARVADAAAKKQAMGADWNPHWDEVSARLGQYQAVGFVKNGYSFDMKDLGTFDDWDSAQDMVEIWAGQVGADLFSKKDRKWRRQPAQEKQIKYARQLGIKLDADMTRGRVSQAIAHALAVKTLRQARLIGA